MPTYEVEGVTPIIYRSRSIEKIVELVEKVAPYKSTVLITGESGTGKDLFARIIHKKSPRANKPFVVINCGAIPPTLIESELFGHTKGSFTGAHETRIGHFEHANHGTVMLDEISELPLDLQVKILRVIETGEILRIGGRDPIRLDVRIIAATNKPLDRAVEEGDFREDLYYRLNVVSIEIPPLRERPEDIEELAVHFLDQFADRLKKRASRFSKGAMVMLKSYDWPGNVRELENAIEQTLVLTDDQKEEVSELDLPVFLERRGRERMARFMKEVLSKKVTIDDYARQFILKFQNEYTEKDLAKLLGITPKTLWEKRKKWKMPRPKRSSLKNRS